jgi:prepilin-type N-terminal cleavage/methylation domain-containing protein
MTTRSARGFTLVELMVCAAIIGILSAVAVPNMMRSSLRAKKAERDVILKGVETGATALLVKDGRFPFPFTGPLNPATAPGASKQRFDIMAPGWRDLSLVIKGDVYHQYFFEGLQPVNAPMQIRFLARGDLDEDGVLSSRIVTMEVRDGALLVLTDVADNGMVF